MPAPRIAFQSSLPRSGSTLFSNIIGQNPLFHVTPTSGLLDLLYVAREQYNSGLEFKAQDQELMEKAFLGFCRGGLEGYCIGLTDKQWVLDKSRGWGIHYQFLNAFYPDPRIVCMVRDPVDIFCSMERNFRNASLKSSGFVNHAEMLNTSLEKRMDHWASSPPVGLALERLLEVVRQGLDRHLLFIRYEDLCSNPKAELERFYSYLELTFYPGHDFEKVKQVTQENDTLYGMFGDHLIRERVAPMPSQALQVLGSNLCDWVHNRYAWFYDRFGYAVD